MAEEYHGECGRGRGQRRPHQSSVPAGCARGTYLDVRAGVDLVHCVPGGAPRLSVQVVALHKHSVVAKAAHPYVSFAFTLQLHSLTNVEPGRKQGKIGWEFKKGQYKAVVWNLRTATLPLSEASCTMNLIEYITTWFCLQYTICFTIVISDIIIIIIISDIFEK